MKRFSPRLQPDFSWGRLGLILLGSAIASFGLYNIHQQCGITEGGVQSRSIGISLPRHPSGLSPLPATLLTLGLWLDRSIIIPMQGHCPKVSNTFITV